MKKKKLKFEKQHINAYTNESFCRQLTVFKIFIVVCCYLENFSIIENELMLTRKKKK